MPARGRGGLRAPHLLAEGEAVGEARQLVEVRERREPPCIVRALDPEHQGATEAAILDAFDEVVVRAGADRLTGHRVVVDAAVDEERDVRGHLAELHHRVEPARVREREVHQHRVEAGGGRDELRVLETMHGVAAPPIAAQPLREQRGVVRVVLDHQRDRLDALGRLRLGAAAVGQLDRAPDDLEELLVVPRLGHDAHGGHLGRGAALQVEVGHAGDHHEGHVRLNARDVLDELHPVHDGHAQVGHDGGEESTLRQLDRLDGRVRDHHLEALALEPTGEGAGERLVVVDEEDGRPGHGRRLRDDPLIRPSPAACSACFGVRHHLSQRSRAGRL